MTETGVKMPGEYRKEVDSKWRKYEKNKNRLLKKIERYSLFDGEYKERIKREILENFLGKEKEEKEGKEYLNALELLGIAKEKYKELEQKKENLRRLEEERGEIEKKIDEYEVNIVDVTTIDRQEAKLHEIGKSLGNMNLRVEEAKKEVMEMEEEIKAMEESYGKMEDVESDEADTIEVENEEMVGDGLEKGSIEGENRKVTLKEYRKNTLSDLREKNRVKRAIIKLLDEGVGIDDKLRDRVKEEVKNKYDEYSKEKTESIEMKSANLLGKRLKNRKERYKKIKSMPEGEEKEKALESLKKEEKAYGVKSLVEMERKREEEKREREYEERKREYEEGLGKNGLRTLKGSRYEWEKRIKGINLEKKQRIMDVVDKMQIKAKMEEDGSRLVEFKVGGEWYRILDVSLHGRPGYSGHEVYFNGIKGNDPDGWSNRTVAKYVKEKNKEGFSIPSQDELRSLLGKLGSEANLEKESDQIAMLMYLTGMSCSFLSGYWLSADRKNKRGDLGCSNRGFMRGIESTDYDISLRLFLLSVKDAEEVEREEREKEENEETVEEITDPEIEEQIDPETEESEEVEEIEVTGDTLRRIRENFIIEWYERKLNRDELLRVLGGIETIDKEKRKKVEEEIIKEFYENYEKAKKETEGYEEAEEMYRGKGEKKGIKRVRRELVNKEKEVKTKKEETKGEIEEIEGEQLDMALKVAELRDRSTGWWKRMGLEKKLENIDEKREELREKGDKINKEIGELEKDKKELEKKLKEQEKKYGGKIVRGEKSKVEKKGYGGVEMEEVKEETLKGYKEKYEKMVKDKEEYMKEFMKRLVDMEIGVSDEKKKGVMEMVEKGLKEEMARLKEGDKTVKKAKEVEKWLKENWEKKMAELSELEKKMEEKEKELEEIEQRLKDGSISAEKKRKEKMKLLEIGREFAGLKSKRDEIKGECDGKYESYYGITYGEMMQKIANEEEETKKMLDPFRKLRKEKIELDSRYIREEIIKAADKVPVKINIEPDGSRMIEIKMGGKTYKILDVNLDSNSSEKVCEYDYNGKIRKGVYLSGIKGANLDKWENKKLAKYIKQQRERGFDIPTEEFQKEILNGLTSYLGCDFDVEQQIALRIYVTGLHGCYLLKNHRYVRFGLADLKFSNDSDAYNDIGVGASIYLILCE